MVFVVCCSFFLWETVWNENIKNKNLLRNSYSKENLTSLGKWRAFWDFFLTYLHYYFIILVVVVLFTWGVDVYSSTAIAVAWTPVPPVMGMVRFPQVSLGATAKPSIGQRKEADSVWRKHRSPLPPLWWLQAQTVPLDIPLGDEPPPYSAVHNKQISAFRTQWYIISVRSLGTTGRSPSEHKTQRWDLSFPTISSLPVTWVRSVPKLCRLGGS